MGSLYRSNKANKCVKTLKGNRAQFGNLSSRAIVFGRGWLDRLEKVELYRIRKKKTSLMTNRGQEGSQVRGGDDVET